MADKCKIKKCDRNAWVGGLCSAHYWRKQHGVDMSLPIREYKGLGVRKHGLSMKKGNGYSSWKTMRSQARKLEIGVLKDWSSFENFIKDMGKPPPGAQLRRHRTDKGYRPSNCFWWTPSDD